MIDNLPVCQVTEILERLEMPAEGSVYVAELPELMATADAKAIGRRFFGETACEVGVCYGYNSQMNAMEWHRCSELNVAVTPLVLLLGDVRDVENGEYDAGRVEAFYLEKGAVVEVYGPTLHFCPCQVSAAGFICLVGLTKGTNLPLEEASEEHPAKPVSIYKFGLWSAQQRFLLPECKGAIHATTADYNARAKLLIVGLTTGLFSLYEVPGFSLVHSLSIGTSDVSSCAINRSGDWLAFGCSQLGQLLVWEWQSETFVLKQQGHYYGISALEFSPDGSVIATGGDDGKVKLWSVMSGFCFVTFAEHTAAVTDICYVKGSHAIVSASLDGTVRAFDLVRYRNFRTLTTPTPVQFTCVTCDRYPSLSTHSRLARVT